MLHHQTEEEKQLWKALGGGKPISLPVSPTGTGKEIRQVSEILKLEYKNTKRRNGLLLAFWILWCIFRLLIVEPGVILDPIAAVISTLLFTFVGMVAIVKVVMKPTARWTNGTLALVSLSKYASAEEALGPLLYVASKNVHPNYLKGDVPTVELYQRLAYVLTHQAGFIPDRDELRFLKQVVLNSKRYPEPLRIAALLTLGDQTGLLDNTFWTRLESWTKKERSEAFLAAARDILSRK